MEIEQAKKTKIELTIDTFEIVLQHPDATSFITPPMLKVALAALREQQERINPKPLTLDELKERVGKPVWIEWVNKGNRDLYSGEDGWAIVHSWWDLSAYKKTYICYVHEPKGGEQPK